MVGIIVSPNEPDTINLSDYFDPTTHTATEANFLNLLQDEIYTENAIGYKVILSNSAAYNNGTYIIADVNHDSANTGQTNCYDLISVDCIYPGSSFGISQDWKYSYIRTWLNNTFYNGLSSDIKSHIMNIKYNSQGTWYNEDKVTSPSFIEVNGTTGTTSGGYDSEGVPYPIFTDNNSRIKYQLGTTNAFNWWIRSRAIGNYNYVWKVYTDGSLLASRYSVSGYCVVPLLRVS